MGATNVSCNGAPFTTRFSPRIRMLIARAHWNTIYRMLTIFQGYCKELTQIMPSEAMPAFGWV